MGDFKKKLNTFKENVFSRKKQISIVAIILVAIAIATTLIYKNIEQARMLASNSELAKAMTYDQVKEGEEIVEGTDGNVKFDAFFLRDLNGDGYTESIRGTSKQIGKEDTLYMELKVDITGYLKDAKITVNEESNFYLQTALPKDDELKDNYIGNNTKVIEFNQLNNGTQKMITGIVRSGDYSYSSSKNSAIGNNINNYGKVNSVTLTGTYVNGEEEIPITKTVNFNIDWYGTAKATISTTNSTYSDIEDRIDEENGTITLDFTINTRETNNELLLKKNYVEAEIPELNGYAPISVEYTGSNATANYNEAARKLTIDREAKVSEDGTITSSVSTSNSYGVKVIYPIEAYQELGDDTVTIKIPVSTYYEGFNNKSEEFTNPYTSNVAKATLTVNYRKPTGTVARVDVTVGKNVYDPTSRYIVSKQKPLKIYNGASEEEKDDTYQVRWYVTTGTNGESTGLVLKETQNDQEQVTDNFIKTDSSKETMENLTTNVGIGFSGADNVLKEDGWIKVYDEDTGDLLATFTKEDWGSYTSSNPYRYDLPVKHIRVETSSTNANSGFYVYNLKELDDDYITTNYTKEQFDSLQYIESNLVGYLGTTYIGKDTHQAHYEAPFSIAEIALSNNAISTQMTEKNEKITIKANYNSSSNQVGWVDGSFIVKLPEEILTAEINGIEISNSNVSITSYELIEKENTKLIKINTKNNNDTAQSYNITIDVNITPDPRVATTTKNIELYASNEEVSNYYYSKNDVYDVNDNLNTDEVVNYDTTSLSMVSPNSLLTNQVANNYDDKGSQVVSPEIADIKPVYAVVDQGKEKEATIGVQVRNNYASTISEIQILGKIPFEGNTYVLSGGDLGSTFTTKIKDTGVTIPEDLQAYATVYYSDNENPDTDLTKAENNWKTKEEITNWDNVKTFLIDLGDYVMPTGAEYVFNYTVKVPNGLEFNKVSFSHHGVYFALDTEQGKYKTQVEPNKLGFRIAEKFNLELTKYQTGKDKLVPGATYSITDEETGETKTAVTNASGILTINNLYAEKAYVIKEIKTPNDYELNGDSIRFIGHVNDEGILSIEKTQGNTREDIGVTKEEGQDYKVTVKVEDEVKASIKIHKTEKGTNTPLQYVRYKLTGYNLSENGRTITTNSNGEATISGLSINQEYTLQETRAEGYYLADPITFKIINDNGNYKIETVEATETTINQSTEEVDSIPTITLNLEDEKIPTYSLQIIKQEKTIDAELTDDQTKVGETTDNNTEIKFLQGAKFKLYKNDEEIGEYITDSNGTVTIDNLYQFIEGKDEEATYTLKEVLAPDGYAKVKDITFKVENKDNTLSLLNIDGTQENYTVEGTTVKLTIEDSPSFRLIKKDKETQAPIANVKFAIYNVEDGEVPATNSKGEILGTKEIINNKEYYTLTTNDQGVITADLKEGLYKAVELEAPAQYDIENQTYYFGIGASREAPEDMLPVWADSFGGSSGDQITSVAATSDGGYIVGGYFSESIQVGNETLINNGSSDGLIIKYASNGEVEWAKSVGGSSAERITSVASTSDGGYIVGGYFQSSSIQVGGYTLTNSRSAYFDGLIIKYASNGEVEWAKSIGGSGQDYVNSVAATSDGGYIVGGDFNSSSIQVGDYTLTNNGNEDGLIIKYANNGEVEWAKSIGGSINDYIYSVASTSDGGYIVGGNFYSSSIQVGDYTLTNNGNYDGLIIKYSSTGEVEWAKSIGGSGDDRITSVASTSDGGYIVGGYFYSSIQVGNETLTNNGREDGLIIKYSSTGEVEWAKSIGGSSYDQITSVAATSDGGYIAGGYFYGTIQVGNETLINNGNYDGLIIKYKANGEVEWVKSFGGSSSDYINSVAETSDGGYVVGGYFSSSIQVGNETLTNNGSSDGLIIKYEMQEVANPVVTNAKVIGGYTNDYINSVSETSDGGYIVGGYFQSSSIQVGDYTLTSNGSNDGLIIKYASNGEVEWAKSFGGSSIDYIKSVASTSDGGYIVGGYFRSSSIQVGDYRLTNNGNYDGLIIKYSKEGEVEWAKSFGGSSTDEITSVAATSDGGYIVGGYFSGDKIQVGDYTLTNNGNHDGLIIKYSKEGEVEWAKSIGGSSEITSVAATSDGGYIVGGYFNSISIQVGDYELTNNTSSGGWSDGLIIKYSKEGEVEWAKSFGGSSLDKITSVAATSDGGYIVGGYFYSSSIQVGNYTLTNNGSTSYADGLIIKYNAEGEVEWAKSFGGNNSDQITSVASTSDGGYIVGGHFYGRIQVGNEELESNGSYDGLIIKYKANGEVEWAKSVGESKSDSINSVAETSEGKVVAGGYFESDTIDVDGHTLENQGGSDGMILEVVNQVGVPEIQELVVENSRKEFNITTDVNEIDGIKGGSISGEDMASYEKVLYGENSTESIVMTPEEGYEIIGITVNGEEWKFEENPDGTYTMPQFENVTEDKHIVVTYSLKDNKIIINKVDSEDNSKKLSGATFKLDQLEERTDPNNEEIIGDITANGEEYVLADTEKGEIAGVLGTLTNNGTYYFVENEDGTLTPTNSKTYQTANGGTAGVGNTTANSYIPIDLSSKSGEYVVVVNANVSSENVDYGYATVNQSTTAPSYSSSTGRFMYISGTSSSVTTAKDYTSNVLQGGQTYYLHLGYRKDGSADTRDDQVVINSIKVYEKKGLTYNFIDNGSGGYESNNQGKDSTVANSYIPIDLTNYSGKYNLTVNANVSSASGDYGYATITSSTTAPTYSSSTGRFIYISGEQDAQDYTTELQGGQMYYLHLGYYKNSSTSTGDDKFTVNSIKITNSSSELYHTEVTTNMDGQAITQIPFGKYQITEVVAPEGYELNSEPTVVEFREDGNHEFTIENNKKAKVLVHHYLKTNDGEYTTISVAEDELLEGKNGEKYTTSPKLDLSDYELEKDEEGNYVLPENATGTFEPGTIEVTYYYVEKEIPLTVHHYIEGTEEKVPLKDEGVAEDVTDSGKEGEEYHTVAIDDSLLSEDYELVEVPEEASGTYSGEEVVVTYYYKKVEREVIINKYSEDSKTPLAGVEFNIKTKDASEDIGTYTTNENGQISVTLESGEYVATEVSVPEGYDMPADNETEFSVTKENDVVTLDITNTKTKGTVITHHYIEGTKTQVPSNSGTVVGDVTQTGNVGDIYATKEAENVALNYEFVRTEGQTSGNIVEGTTEVIYYYKLKDPSITSEITKESSIEKITDEEQTIDYKVNYKATIGDYKGKATVTIVDELPYEIDESKAYELAGGEYNKESKTITWTEEIGDIDTFVNSAYNVDITKEISLVYKDVDVTKDSISNKVTGTIKLETPEKEDTKETTKDIPAEYLVSFPVTKHWLNGNVARPRELTIIVKNGNQEVARKTIINEEYFQDDVWETEITGLPKYDESGNEINYTVDEEYSSSGPGSFNKEITGNMKEGFVITNTYDTALNIIRIKKVWKDNNTPEQISKRPESIQVTISPLYGGEGTSETVTLTAPNWEKEVYVQQFTIDAVQIEYSVKEVNIENKFYKNTSIEGNMFSGFTITNTFSVPDEKVSIIANKVWNDNTEQSARRPESITLVAKNSKTGEELGSEVLTKDNLVSGTTNQWSVEFTELPKYDSNGDEIEYAIEEKETTEGDLDFYKAEENSVIVEDGQATIRNNFVVPDDTVSVTVEKIWDDNNNSYARRPESVILKLSGNGQEYSEVVTENDNWTHTFTDLPEYDENGKEIEYTASESEVNSGDLKFYENTNVSGDMTSGYTITNTFTVPDEKIELTVNKVWKDNDIQAQTRPSVVVINVLGEDGSVVATYDLNTATETSHTFAGLDKYNNKGQEINYKVEEKEKKPGDLYFYTGVVGNVENTSENSKKVTITNTFKKPDDKTDVLVTKVWDDNNNEAGKRPTSIKLLLKIGSETVEEQEVTGETNNWAYTFTGVEKYNENGQEIVYTVDEDEVNSGDLQFYNKSVNGLVVTNTFTQNTTKVDLPVTKVWVDNAEQSSRRPESVIIVLKANGAEKERYELSGSGNTWSYTFKDLPKYDELNNIINYTVEELEAKSGDLKFYTTSVDGTTITNTFTRPSDVISIEVTKNWVDQENVYGKRPVSVRVNVKDGEEVVQTAVVTKDNLWKYKFTNLPKYDENGQEIVYTLSEEEVIANDLFYYTGEVGDITNVSGNEFEATITNNMTKIPGKVIVRYVDKATGEEITGNKEKEGIVGEEFDVTEDKKEIPGYTLVEEPEEKTGTYTPEVQEKIYYYAKNTKVIVKYLEKDGTPEDDSDNKVLSEQILIEGYEGQSYTTNSKVIDGYTLVETKGDLNGTMTKEEKVVVYYYAKNTKVIVKYVEKSTGNELLPEKTIDGYVGKKYTTVEEIIPNYTLVEKTTNFEGTMTEEVIEVVYYYAQNTNVVVKYLEKDTNAVLSEEVLITGFEGKDYETEKKEIENYTFVEDTGNTSGKMTKEQIEVIYYYAQNTKAKVEHIDRETGKILKEETKDGKVGDLFETHPEDFEGYVLVEEPSEPNIIMDKTGEQVVRYYYVHISAGVIEKHIDIITGELLDSSEHKGNEGDSYNIPSKEFSGYDLVTDKLPDNSSGTMKRDEVIEVKYYYIKKVTVVVKYVDEVTGEEIEGVERTTIEGHENDDYTTEKKDIPEYNLVGDSGNTSGKMVTTKNPDGTYDTEIEVIYYYKKQAGGVIENHIDIDTDKKLATEEHKGNVGDEYDIPSRTFEGYDLVTDKLPGNSKGTMTEEEIIVNYYYKKKAKVIVEYIDKLTGEKIVEDVLINGHIGDEYTTEEKVFDGYDLIEKPVNGEGTMTEGEIIVKYYYQRNAEVEVKYLEKGTDYEVSEGSLIKGYVGDEYETEQKDIPYYKFVEKTENWKGTMTKEKITVIYYYEKEIFNLGVDKWVESVNINGISSLAQNINNSDEIYKVDIHRSKADTAEIKVKYKIRITNKGEIEGTVGKITDIIPSGYTFNQEDNNIYWENNSGILTTDVLSNETIKPGEYKEIEVVLRASEASEKYGQKDNMVILTEVNNPAGYEDIDKEDNSDTSSMIITIATGLDRNDRIVIIGIVQIVLAITIGLLLSYKKKEKKPKE